MKGFDDKMLSIIFFPYKFIENNMDNNKTHLIFKNNKTKKVFVVCQQWMGKDIFYKHLIKKLSKYYTIVLYRLPNKVLYDDPVATVDRFENAKKELLGIVAKLEEEGFDDFSILGNSLSCGLALMVANSCNKFKRVILNLTGDDIAECFWESSNLVVRRIKNVYIKNGIKLDYLKKCWSEISPVNNIKNLKKQELLIFLSRNDDFVNFKSGEKFVHELKKRKIRYKLIIDNIFGHYISGVKNLVFNDSIIKFLNR